MSSSASDSPNDMSVALCLRFGVSLRLAREALERPLLPDRTEALPSSVLSAEPSPLLRRAELRGLSVFELPGILDLSERNEREESFVSDLLIDG